MASLWKHPKSKFWVACYTDTTGRQRKVSTKIVATEKTRKQAMRIADEMESAHKTRATTTQIVRMLGGLVKEVTGQDMASMTVRGFIEGYLKRRKGEVKPNTFAAYKTAAETFLKWLGESAEDDMFRIERQHIQGFRDHLATRLSTVSANKYLKYLRVFFADAKRDRVIFENPCEDVATLKQQTAGTSRRGFSLKELGVVMREVAGTEWVSLVRLGLYTGQRIGDLAGLRWGAVDLVHDEIRFTTAKTGRVVIVPICAPLKEHLLSLPASDSPDALVHPRAASLGTNALSREFGEVLARCGFRARASHRKIEGREGGRSSARKGNELCFHSLRYSAVSMMKNAGISSAIVQDVVGHESAEISAHYTHIDNDAKRKAVASLPKI
ncbi:MAG: tyrosine-type recombinase/integrase [Verrucomicrobiaceae bacterium]|nr:tyrosine-type recombinase/integrase [Verrucomicrobiaceae bacterium]